jgi:hypothetical protein
MAAPQGISSLIRPTREGLTEQTMIKSSRASGSTQSPPLKLPNCHRLHLQNYV